MTYHFTPHVLTQRRLGPIGVEKGVREGGVTAQSPGTLDVAVSQLHKELWGPSRSTDQTRRTLLGESGYPDEQPQGFYSSGASSRTSRSTCGGGDTSPPKQQGNPQPKTRHAGLISAHGTGPFQATWLFSCLVLGQMTSSAACPHPCNTLPATLTH